MSTSIRRQVALTWAVLFALALAVDLTRGHDRPDEVSFRAGYSAASDAAQFPIPMAAGTNAQSACDALLDRRLGTAGSSHLIRQDFVSGCTRAVSEAME